MNSLTKPARTILLVLGGMLVAGWLVSRRPAPSSRPGMIASTNEASNGGPLNSPIPRGRSTPRFSVTTEEPVANTTNLVTRALNGEEVKLNLDQVADFLLANRRNVDSLLGAFAATGDRSLLREAMERFPDDPRVAAAAYFLISPDEMSADQRHQWLEAWQRSDPGNSIPPFLTALAQLKSGETVAAKESLQAAVNGSFNDHIVESIQDATDAWRAAGFSEAEAKTVASMGALLPELAPLKQLGVQLSDLALASENAGDPATANYLRQSALALGQQLQSGQGTVLVTELVGIAIEKKILGTLPPDGPYGDGETTVQDRLDQLADIKANTRELADATSEIVPRMTDQDRISFVDRILTLGEVAAMQWAVEKYGKK